MERRDKLHNRWHFSASNYKSYTEQKEQHTKMASTPPTFFFFFLLLLPFVITADKCDKNDKRALLAIKSAFNNAYHFASWTPTDACCDWYGVECDPTVPNNSAGSRVTGLYVVTDDNVTGPIPSAVGDLPFLTSLRFHKLPNLVGNIPSSITRLTRLSLLLLTWNSLSGPIPSFLSQIPSLTQIDLSFNLFSGQIPPQLVNLPS